MPRRNPEDENDREFLRFYEFQKQIAAHRMAAEDCRRRARYDFEALLEAREHDAEAERLTEEYKAWSAARQAAEAAKARPGRPRRNPEFDDAAEERIERAVAHFEEIANGALAELEDPGSKRYEEHFDLFVIWLNAHKHEVAGRAREILEGADSELAGIDKDTLLDAVRDPTVYKFGLNSTGKKNTNAVFSEFVGFQEIIFSDRQSILRDLVLKEGFSPAEWREAQLRLKNKGIELYHFTDAGDPGALDPKIRVYARGGAHWRMEARMTRLGLVDKLRELIAEQEKSDEPDEVVYRYAGTNDTVAGASARGFYVASLRPDQLRAEGAALGICVGKEEMGYKKKVLDGVIQIFSIRTEAGESKFCIERLVRGESELNFETNEWERLFAPSDIAQIKGTANRLPGFEPAAFVLTKPDEVRLVVEFLQALGYKNEAIARMNDIGPGVETMVENGIDPFIPPLKRQRPVLSPEEREARKQAAMRRRGAAENPALVPSPQTAAMIQEDYAHPWGGRWGT